MKENKGATMECKSSSGRRIWKIVGGAALVLVAATVIASLDDIRRYIRIMRM
jgi:hypothetical protein